MKYIKFTFRNGFQEPIIETFPFDDGGAGEIAVEIAFDALAAIGGDDE